MNGRWQTQRAPISRTRTTSTRTIYLAVDGQKTAQHQPPSLRLVPAALSCIVRTAGRAHSFTLGEGLGDGSTLGSPGNCSLGPSGNGLGESGP
jgi:hypothetical protein